MLAICLIVKLFIATVDTGAQLLVLTPWIAEVVVLNEVNMDSGPSIQGNDGYDRVHGTHTVS